MRDVQPPACSHLLSFLPAAGRCLCLLAILMGPASRAESGDWPQFRGPMGQGHSPETGLPIRWSESENIRWKVPIPGLGWSSPIVVGGRVYLTTAVATSDDPKSQERSLRAVCLDAATGDVVWDREVFQQRHDDTKPIHGKNSHASPTPLSDGEFLFVHFGTNGTACLTLDGRIVWRNRELVYDPRHGSGGSPVLVDDLLVVSCDGYDVQFVAALDRRTGRFRWRTERPETDSIKKFAFSTPLVIDVDGTKQIVCTGANSVVAYDPADGMEVWIVRHPGYSVVPRPVYEHGLVYICTSFNDSELLAVRPTGSGDVTETHVEWRHRRAVPHTPSLLIIGDELYAVSDRGIASCLDARTGRAHWTRRIGGNFSASPVYADGRIYLLSEEGEATVIEPGREFVELARSQVNDRAFASLAVSDGALFLRTEKELFRIEELP